jgi:hypothetical protein
MLFKMLLIEWSSLLLSSSTEDSSSQKCRQLFVTQSPVLAGRVERYFKNLLLSIEAATLSPSELKDLAAHVKSKQEGDEDEARALADPDDQPEKDWKSSLPKKFSLLCDEHFPLFITYHHVSSGPDSNIANLIFPVA